MCNMHIYMIIYMIYAMYIKQRHAHTHTPNNGTDSQERKQPSIAASLISPRFFHVVAVVTSRQSIFRPILSVDELVVTWIIIHIRTGYGMNSYSEL